MDKEKKTYKAFMNNLVAKHAQKYAKGSGFHGKTKKAKRRKERVNLDKELKRDD